MAKKKREDSKQQESKGSKELKITTIHVVTPDKVLSNERQVSLLYLIDKFGPLHEKTIMKLVYMLNEKGYNLGYNFRLVGDSPYSPELKNDLVALLYVGFIEAETTLYRKLRTTGEGKDALAKANVPKGLIDVINKNFEEFRNTASMVDSELDLQIRNRFRELQRGGRRRAPLF